MPHPNALALDTSYCAPEQTAQRISPASEGRNQFSLDEFPNFMKSLD